MSIPHLKPFLWLVYNLCFYFFIMMMIMKLYFLK